MNKRRRYKAKRRRADKRWAEQQGLTEAARAELVKDFNELLNDPDYWKYEQETPRSSNG